MIRRIALFAVSALMLADAAHAQLAAIPEPGPGDSRIREILYDPNQVVALQGRLGFDMTVEFNPDERIENVSVGDSVSWLIQPNRKATLLFIKPTAKTTPTSMTVVTTERIYSFVLSTAETLAQSEPDTLLRLRFLYPEEPAAPLPPTPAPAPQPRPEDLNFAYTFSGAKVLTPARVFDDGKSTYFEFTPAKDMPAVFVIGVDGKEEMANTRIAGRYTVADYVAKTFVLVYGKARLQVRNTGWRDAIPAQNTPPPPAPPPVVPPPVVQER